MNLHNSEPKTETELGLNLVLGTLIIYTKISRFFLILVT
jgi:hypothetical protein